MQSNTKAQVNPIQNRYKLLVLDVDGTLVNKTGTISSLDRQAIFEAQANGISVALSTGRAVSACRHILDELSLKGYHIFFDGALVYDCWTNQELYSRHIPADTVKKISHLALQNKIPLDLFTIHHLFVMEESWRTQIRRDFFKVYSTVADFKDIWEQKPIIKGGLVTGTPEDENKARSFISQFENCLSFCWTVAPAFPDCYFININDAGVSKGKALEALTSHLGLSLDQVAAIGDGVNDISLLSTAGLGIAMQNSPAELKSVAGYITADVDHSGVAQAIRKFLI